MKTESLISPRCALIPTALLFGGLWGAIVVGTLPTQAAALVDATTPGYYNDALGTILDGTAPQFPLPYPTGGDPTIYPADEPSLEAATAVLGNWLASPPGLNSNWDWETTIPSSWAVNTETAIIYVVHGGAHGFTNVLGDFDADNGLSVWVNGQFKFGAVAPGLPSATGQFEYTNVNLGNLPPGTNYIQVLRQDNGIATGYQVRISGEPAGAPPPGIVNLLFNGDFEAGNVGFTTDYQYVSSDTEDPGPGHYGVITNPTSWNGFFATYGDHTSGTGLMLVVDSSTTPSQTFWRQTVSVPADTDYRFSCWVANPYPGTPPTLQVFINGQQQGGDFSPGAATGVWQKFETTWNSAGATQAVIELSSVLTTYVGNDLTLDDVMFMAATPDTGRPTISGQPQNLEVPAGETAQFWITATGAEPLTYQWFMAGDPISGATAALLALSNVQPAQAGGYYVTVSNAFGVATSSNAMLTVQTFPPTISGQPIDRTSYTGKTVSFTVTASGTQPLHYQWSKNGTPIPNATNAVFNLLNVQLSDAGLYDVVVTNLYGSATSRRASLTVQPAPVCVEPPQGVIAWWPGQSNTWDVIGGFDGVFQTLPPSPSPYTEGKVGASVNLQNGGYLQVSHTGGLDVGAGAGLTIEGWIRPVGSFVMPVLEWNDGFGNVGAGLTINVNGLGTIEATLTDTNAPKKVLTFRSAPGAITSGAWQHVALTYNKAAGLAAIYVNGLPVVQTNAGTMTLHTVTNVYIGYRRSGTFSGARFIGALDEMTIYDRPLAQAQLQAIVAADEAGKCSPPPPPCLTPPASIAGWWRGESNTLDHVAGNHGVLTPTNFAAAAAYQAGQINTAFALRGQNYVAVPRSDVLDVGRADGLTVEAWIYPNQYRPMPIVEWGDGTSAGVNFWSSYSRGPSVLEANLIDTSGAYHLIQSPINTLGYNFWQHVAVTYDKASGLAKLYLNGTAVVTTNLGGFTPRTDTGLFIGYHPPFAGPFIQYSPPSSPYWFSGAMDEVAVYRRALNATEIRGIVNSRPGKCLELSPTIGREPQDQIAIEGSAVAFEVAAGGSVPLDYQWLRAGAVIDGAVDSKFQMAPVALNDAGMYSVIVSNALGSVTSRVATLTVLPVGQCLPPPEGTVAWWMGEYNEWDALQAHDGFWPVGAVPSYTDGKVNNAFQFNGSTYSYLQVPANADLDVSRGEGFSVEGWIKPDSMSVGALVDWNDGMGNVGAGLMLGRAGPGVLEVTLTDTNALSSLNRTVTFATPNFAVGSTTNPLPGWTHLALAFNKTNGLVKLWVNGAIVVERSIAPILTRTSPQVPVPFTPATTGDLYLGWRRSGTYSGPRFRGAMDEMTVYRRALSQSEVQSIYLVGSNGKCPPPPPQCLAPVPEIVGWWRGESNTLDSVQQNHASILPVGYTTNLSFGPGRIGYGLSFKGPNHFQVPASPSLDVGTGAGLTIEAWINPTQFRPQPIVEWNTGTGQQGVSLSYSFTGGTGTMEANLIDAAGLSHQVFTPRNTVSYNTWLHVAVTYDKASGVVALFYNGSLITQTNLGTFTPRTSADVYFGYRPIGAYPGSGNRFTGAMDEVAIYARALTTAEIGDSFRTRIGKCTLPPVIVQQPVSQRVNIGTTATLFAEVEGNPLLRYQWFKDGAALGNGRASVYEISAASIGDEGIYHLVVSNNFGVAVSSNALVLVNHPPVADASRTPAVIISSNNTNATAVLDGTLSSDPDDDPLTYDWYLAGAGTPLATGAVAMVTLPVGRQPIQLVVNDGLRASTNQIVVEVLTTGGAVGRLADLVAAGVDNPAPLLASLRAALAAVDRGQPAVAINQLEAFKNKVRAQVLPKNQELAARLLAEVQAIIDALGGGAEAEVALQITSIREGNNGRPQLKIRGRANRTHVVEVSANLVDWTPVGVASMCGDCEYEFDDQRSASGGTRFYRVVSPR